MGQFNSLKDVADAIDDELADTPAKRKWFDERINEYDVLRRESNQALEEYERLQMQEFAQIGRHEVPDPELLAQMDRQKKLIRPHPMTSKKDLDNMELFGVIANRLELELCEQCFILAAIHDHFLPKRTKLIQFGDVWDRTDLFVFRETIDNYDESLAESEWMFHEVKASMLAAGVPMEPTAPSAPPDGTGMNPTTEEPPPAVVNNVTNNHHTTVIVASTNLNSVTPPKPPGKNPPHDNTLTRAELKVQDQYRQGLAALIEDQPNTEHTNKDVYLRCVALNMDTGTYDTWKRTLNRAKSKIAIPITPTDTPRSAVPRSHFETRK